MQSLIQMVVTQDTELLNKINQTVLHSVFTCFIVSFSRDK